MGRELRSHLSNLHPALAHTVDKAQQKQKLHHDKHAKQRNFDLGDEVYARSYSPGTARWVPSTVVKETGPVSAMIDLGLSLIHI